MEKRSRLPLCASIVMAITTALWFTASIESPSTLQRIESAIAPTASAARINQAATVDAQSPLEQHSQVDAAQLLVAGSMLFGLAAMVRRIAI
jgi:hypothetical protein